MMTKAFRDFPKSFQSDSGIVMEIGTCPLPSTSLPVQCSLSILSFGATSCDPLTASLNKTHMWHLKFICRLPGEIQGACRSITLTSAGRTVMLSSTTKNLHKIFSYPCYRTYQSHLPLILSLCFSTCYLTPLGSNNDLWSTALFFSISPDKRWTVLWSELFSQRHCQSYAGITLNNRYNFVKTV
jgi:hypothetical protein